MLKLSVAKQQEFDNVSEEEFQKILEEVKKDKDGFVLKPNCEGGGNNFFKEDVFNELSICSPETRLKYILM